MGSKRALETSAEEKEDEKSKLARHDSHDKEENVTETTGTATDAADHTIATGRDQAQEVGNDAHRRKVSELMQSGGAVDHEHDHEQQQDATKMPDAVEAPFDAYADYIQWCQSKSKK